MRLKPLPYMESSKALFTPFGAFYVVIRSMPVDMTLFRLFSGTN